jgi:UDP-N-acetylglucosamine--N-acetylmuramyl-(pentapeptide) pyrophosphoryl-undecaprenol N-acetylglucosamine transferase
MTAERRPPFVLLAAGGTGGHIFPAEALAGALRRRGVRVELATDRRGGSYGGGLAEVPAHFVRSATPGRGVWGKVKAGLTLLQGLMQARVLVGNLDPDLVVGFGGYPSVPTVYAAALAKKPVLLHEQNAVLGRANRLLMGSAQRIAVAFPGVGRGRLELEAKLIRTGNPVRPAVAARRGAPYEPPRAGGPVRLFVMGGSQGAKIFSTVVPEALARLPAELRGRIAISQQARADDLDTARAGLEPLGLAAFETAAFFADVPERLEACHLAITRAGASTIAELTCIGRPAILVPYPHAMDDHQTANARAVADAGGAWLMPQSALTAESLAERLSALLADPDALTAAAAAARDWGTDQAAERLADAVHDLLATTPRREATT